MKEHGGGLGLGWHVRGLELKGPRHAGLLACCHAAASTLAQLDEGACLGRPSRATTARRDRQGPPARPTPTARPAPSSPWPARPAPSRALWPAPSPTASPPRATTAPRASRAPPVPRAASAPPEHPGPRCAGSFRPGRESRVLLAAFHPWSCPPSAARGAGPSLARGLGRVERLMAGPPSWPTHG
jgi:hypothetical protein